MKVWRQICSNISIRTHCYLGKTLMDELIACSYRADLPSIGQSTYRIRNDPNRAFYE